MYRLHPEHIVTESKKVLNTHTPEAHTHTPHTCTPPTPPHMYTLPHAHHIHAHSHIHITHMYTPQHTHAHHTHTHTAMEYVRIRSQPKEFWVAKAGIVRHQDD